MALKFKHIFTSEGVGGFKIKAYARINLFTLHVQKRAVMSMAEYTLVSA
jgi:hypothetical protein